MTLRLKPQIGPQVALGVSLVFALGGCVDQRLPSANTYSQQDVVQQVPLVFQTNSAELTPLTMAMLQTLRPELRAESSLTLVGSNDLAGPRARQVGTELQRFVAPAPGARPAAGQDDSAVLLVTTHRLIGTDCLAPGQLFTRDNWPADDASRPRSMPPGCATANAIQQMVVSQEDLQRGRPLPPGAALPVARAIERYYNRSEAAAPVTSQANPGLGAGSSAPVGAPTPAAVGATASDAGSDLLQGPLTQPPAATAAPAP